MNKLTPYEFSEVEVVRLAPPGRGRYTYGVHTLSNAGDITLIDGKRSRVNWAVVFARVSGRLRRRQSR